MSSIEKRVANALKENNLLENEDISKKNIYVNKQEDFFKKYTFNDSDINPFPKNVSRNEFGDIVLQDIPFITSNLICNGNSNGQWILLSNGSRIFIKQDKYYNQLLELMFKELCDQLNIKCANYDLVKLDKVYTASQSFLKPNDILFDYYNLELENRKIDTSVNGIKPIEIDELIKKANYIDDYDMLLKTIFIDALTNHYDRFPHNYKMIKRNDDILSAPLFDNSGCCDSLYKYVYCRAATNFSVDNSDIFKKLLESDGFKEWIYEYIHKIIAKAIPDKIYKEKGIYVDSDSYKDFENTINNNLYIMKYLLL